MSLGKKSKSLTSITCVLASLPTINSDMRHGTEQSGVITSIVSAQFCVKMLETTILAAFPNPATTDVNTPRPLSSVIIGTVFKRLLLMKMLCSEFGLAEVNSTIIGTVAPSQSPKLISFINV